MKKIRDLVKYFSGFEIGLWSFSVIFIVASYFIFGGDGPLSLVASLIGVSGLILCAKGNPIGQVLIILFSVLYGIISWSFAYYGEMITYLGMTTPMAVFALISWVRNPYNGKRSEVKVNGIKLPEVLFMLALSAVVTLIFFFILRSLGTANLIPSTLSVTTSFIAVYLTLRRSPYHAVAYALNDVVLILLWIFATAESSTYISVVICFAIFLINDIYGFYSWMRRKARQENS